MELLYRAINEWRRKEVAFIEAHRWGADRKAALAEIMEMEADLLLDLERTKTIIRNSLEGKYVETAFHKVQENSHLNIFAYTIPNSNFDLC